MVTWSHKSTHLCESLLLPHGLARASGGEEENESGFMVYFFLGIWKEFTEVYNWGFYFNLITFAPIACLVLLTPSAIQGNLVAVGFISSGVVENYT